MNSGVMKVAIFTFLDHMPRSGKFCLTFERLLQQHYFNTGFFTAELLSLLDVHVYDKSPGRSIQIFQTYLTFRLFFFFPEKHVSELLLLKAPWGVPLKRILKEGRISVTGLLSHRSFHSFSGKWAGYMYDFLTAFLLSSCVK